MPVLTKALITILCAAFAVSCAPSSVTSLTATPLEKSADTKTAQTLPEGATVIYTGGAIYTGGDGLEKAGAVAVRNGEIVAVGPRRILVNGAEDDAIIIDLGDAVMFPGFTDAHAHLLGIGQREMTLNLEDISSVDALVFRVAGIAQDMADGETLFGRGWIETGWPEGRMPNRIDLDPVSRRNPVILIRADGHAAVVNSLALELAGVNDATPDPDGGKIERDEYGRATGILIDNAIGLVTSLIESPSAEEKAKAFAAGSDVYAAYGWTGLHNMSVNHRNVEMMETLSASGDLGIRVYNSLDRDGFESLVANGQRVSLNGKIVTKALKLYVDGALGSRGAALSEPYSDRPDTSGLLLLKESEALDIFDRAIAAGIQVNTHAIGDRGNKLVLDWYEKAFAANLDAGDLRWRIEHAQILHTDDIARFVELGVIASMQPSHAIGDLFFAPDRLGSDRLDGAYAWRSLIDAGAIIAGGSDAPVERGDPLIEFYAAVARRGLDGTQTQDWRPAQAVTREEALKMFTIWPAYASFQEDLLGTIEPGKRADFTVFSKDIMTIDEEEILTAKPVLTVVDGVIVFDGRGAAAE